jgi:prepilin-type N-terminal cleavage/methylation domain-containing protein
MTVSRPLHVSSETIARRLPGGSPRARCAGFRGGFTLVELLVVIAIIGVLVGLLLPAVQAARESGRRTSCKNNLKQIGLGLLNYESAKGFYPTAVSGGGARHYWIAQILPFLDANPLADIYDYTVACTDVRNQAAVQVPLRFASCPSTPGGPLPDPRFKTGTPAWGSVAADYSGSSGPHNAMWNAPAFISYPKPADVSGFFSGSVTPGKVGRRASEITDGTSKSVAVFESAGRPQIWYAGRMVPGSGDGSSASLYVPLAGWANSNTSVVRGYAIDLSQANPTSQYSYPGPQMLNGCNYYGGYSFHPGVSGLLYVDGSVQFPSESASADVVSAALTIAGSETAQAL